MIYRANVSKKNPYMDHLGMGMCIYLNKVVPLSDVSWFTFPTIDIFTISPIVTRINNQFGYLGGTTL